MRVFRRATAALGLASIVLVSLAPAALASPFGVLMGGCTQTLGAAAEDLGASSIRWRVFVEAWDGTATWCEPFSSRSLNLVLTLRNGSSDGSPSEPPENLAAYEQRVGDIVETMRPKLLVVENEENAAVFWSGSTSEYLDVLQAACRAARAYSVPCTNGGLTNHLVVVTTYQDFLDRDLPEKADSYAKRATFTESEYQRLTSPSFRQSRAEMVALGRSFLDGYRSHGADYVNFHWYGRNAKAFGQTVRYLQRRSGLPAISNEIGQYDSDPDTVVGIMQKVVRLSMDHAIWFSFDYYVKAVDRTTRALHNPDGSLRRHGKAYRDFITGL